MQVKLHTDSTHLVGWNPHGGEPYVRAIQELESRLIKEERAAVWAVVALHIQARRPGFGAKVATVTQTCQDWLEGVIVVVDFLKTQDMRSIDEDLF